MRGVREKRVKLGCRLGKKEKIEEEKEKRE